MSNGILVRLQPLTSPTVIGIPNPGNDPAFPPANAANPQPKVVLKSSLPPAAPLLIIDIDIGYDVPIDTIALLFTNFNAGTTWSVQGASHAAGAGGLAPMAGFGAQAFGVASTTLSNPRHGFIAGTLATVGYLRITVNETALHVMQIGVIAIGTRWLCSMPYANFELGSGRKVNDLSIVQELDGGEFSVFKKAKPAEFRATWSNMTDADLRALWSILLEVGESEPILLIEDPDATTGQLERIHYGLIRSMDFYERQQVDKSRIELRIRDWL